MDLRQLRYFVTVAEERNFNRAADLLAIAQPPLSRAIQQLEADLGCKLLDRQQRPLKLTAMGSLFYEQAVQLLSRAEDVRVMMKAVNGLERRRFTIGYVASTIYARLPALIRAFRAESPDVELVLVESTTIEQIAALKDGRIDVGFGRIRLEDPAVRRTVLRHEPLVAALPSGHALAQDPGPISLAEIGQLPQIIYPRAPRPSYADQVISLFHDLSIEPKIVHEARELQIAIGLVAAEEGVAIVPESVRRARSDDVRYRDLIEKATSPIIMSHRARDASNELATMARVIAGKYAEWGYDVPESLK
ncbi:MAG: LysR family transcriptional regulator [Pseudomonadota bacterium]